MDKFNKNYYSIIINSHGIIYIVGDEGNWVSYNELDFDDKLLNISESDTYYLEWKWVSSDNDTLVGNNINSNYQLKIEMNAEGIN